MYSVQVAFFCLLIPTLMGILDTWALYKGPRCKSALRTCSTKVQHCLCRWNQKWNFSINRIHSSGWDDSLSTYSSRIARKDIYVCLNFAAIFYTIIVVSSRSRLKKTNWPCRVSTVVVCYDGVVVWKVRIVSFGVRLLHVPGDASAAFVCHVPSSQVLVSSGVESALQSGHCRYYKNMNL